MTEEPELINSPLEQTYSADGHTVRIHIYRSADSAWILEIEDECGASTVWDDPFESDQAALDAALQAISEDGIHRFLSGAGKASDDAESEPLHAWARIKRPPPQGRALDLIAPLSEAELYELDQFLQDGLASEDRMTLQMLDGLLHAMVIGPEAVSPTHWLARVWGEVDGALMPDGMDMAQFEHVFGLILRHFTSIVARFALGPQQLAPYWSVLQTERGPLEDAEDWAYGFTEGVKLSQAAWQPLLADVEGQRWYRPIGLLGADAFSDDQEALTRTPEQRHALAADIENSLVQIHAFWQPQRDALAKAHRPQAIRSKVGRNEICPCGSGRKFKKCCGSTPTLH